MISPAYTGRVYETTQESTVERSDASQGVGQEAFLKMFMAQVTNQNPLDPMDNTEFTAQLATFSQLEQLMDINESMKGLTDLTNTMNQSNALDYIGKEIVMSGDKVAMVDSEPGEVGYTLEEAAEVRALIYDDTGALVADVNIGEQGAGANTFQWDGKTTAGADLADGIYTIKISANNSAGDAVKVSDQTSTAFVTGYRKGTDGESYLLIGETALSMSEVLEVRSVPTQQNQEEESSTNSAFQTWKDDTLADDSVPEGSVEDFLKSLASVGTLAAALL